VTLDADGQNDPADIPKLLEQAMLHLSVVTFASLVMKKSQKTQVGSDFQSKIANKVRSTYYMIGTQHRAVKGFS